MSEKEEKRIVPLTQEFMQEKKVLDVIWGYLQLNSYFGKDTNNVNHRFVYKYYYSSKLDLYNKIIARPFEFTTREKRICCYNTFVKSFQLLQKMGYIQEGTILDKDNKVVDVYYLQDRFELFKLIPYDILQELVELYCNNAIKVYVCLLNWYEFKQRTPEKYRFTLENLSFAIGYTSNGYYTELKEILKILEDNDFISYHIQDFIINNRKVYYHILDNVIQERVQIEDNTYGFKF